MFENSDFTTLFIAIGLGLLVGLQRERYHSRIAGIRTFTLITVFGWMSGMIAKVFEQAWVIVAGIVAIAILLGVANFLKKVEKEPDIGQTTEMAALLMFTVGAGLVLINPAIGVVLGATVATLLYLKQYLGQLVDRLGEKDIQTIMLFVAISLIILPVLPNKNFGPYEVFNPREIWWMVVLIVGMSVIGYFIYKWTSDTAGTALNGILGGLISSTATTVTYSRQTKDGSLTILPAGFIIVTASTISMVRVLVEVAVVAPRHLATVAPPLVAMTLLMALIATGLFFYGRGKAPRLTEPENPAQFKTALVFAILYAIILLAVAFVKDYFGDRGLYVVSIISGLTDMDAITLSLSNTMNDGGLAPASGWRFILTAALSNLVFKGGLAAFLGSRRLLGLIAPAFGVALVGGLLILWLWP